MESEQNNINQDLLANSIKKDFAKILKNSDGEGALSAEQTNDFVQGFTKTLMVMDKNPEEYARFIEEKRQKELKEYHELQEKAEAEALSAKEQARLEQVAGTMGLTGEEYFSYNSTKSENALSFIEENPELTEGWLTKLSKQWELGEKKAAEHEKFGKMEPNERSVVSSLSVLKNNFPAIAKCGFSAGMFALNPIGFMQSKVLGAGIQGYFKTEAGQGLVEKANNAWINQFGEGKVSNAIKKGLVTVAMAGAVIGLGMGIDDVGELASNLSQTIGNTTEHLANEAAFHLEKSGVTDAMKTVIESDVSNMNSNYGMGDYKVGAPDVPDNVVERPDNTPQGALNPTETVEPSGRPDNTPKGVFDPAGDTPTERGEMDAPNTDEVIEPAKEWPEKIEVDKPLELIARDLLPEDAPYSDIKELTMKIAEHNNIADADVIMKGVELDIPSMDQLEGIELKEFKVETLNDLNNLDKLPYGSEITPEELQSQIKEVLKNEFPGEEMRQHEMMAHVKATLGELPPNQPIESMGKLDFDKITNQHFGPDKIDIVDEQESPYSYDFIDQNEKLNHSIAAETDPSKLTSDDQETVYDIPEINENEEMHAKMTQEEKALQKLNGGAATASAGATTPPPVEDVPQYKTADAGRVNFDAGEMDTYEKDMAATQANSNIAPTAATASASAQSAPSMPQTSFESNMSDDFFGGKSFDEMKADWDNDFAEKQEEMLDSVKPQSEFTPEEKAAAIDKFEDGSVSYSEKTVTINGQTTTAYSVNGVNIDKANMPSELREIINSPSHNFEDKFGMSKIEAVSEYLNDNPNETINMLEGNKPDSLVQKQENDLLLSLQNESQSPSGSESESTSNRNRLKMS